MHFYEWWSENFLQDGDQIDPASESVDSPAPSSQNMEMRDSATAGTNRTRKEMKEVCGHCCTGQFALDI